MSVLRRGLAPVVVAAALWPARAQAEATFILDSVDPAGTGFNDPTPATPVGGNTGTTVGEQRRIAFEHALSLWGRVLESDVDIVVEASFAPLECSGGFAVLGQAGPAGIQADVPGLEPGVLYPDALADQIVGEDLAPGLPDIQATFNGGLADCFDGYDWYYGLDAEPPVERADLVSTVLHEIAHGLGFLTMVDTDTGADLVPGYTDPYSMRLLDTQTGMTWAELGQSGRAASARRVRQLVWEGRFANEAAATTLALGAPSLAASPAVPGLRDALVDANFGTTLVGASVSGSVVLATPADGCAEISGVAGNIALVLQGTCNLLDKAYFAETAGARAVLVAHAGSPPPTIDQREEFVAQYPVGIPVLGIADDDASLLLGSNSTVQLSADGARRTGTDASGRLFMYATDEGQGSPVSHFDPLMRPDLTMEPLDSPNAHHDIKVERALLRDIGWATSCGNGQLDEGEECDSGTANSDTAADACRIDCRSARCGDGVVDSGETCDAIGAGNAECTNLCRPHECGDGILGPGEQCDSGADNNDVRADACRSDCRSAFCGDGVLDSGEQCEPMLTAECNADCQLGGGGSGGGGAGGGGPGGGGPGSGGEAGGDAGGGATSGGSAGTSGGSTVVAPAEASCSCRSPGSPGRAASGAPLLLALAVLARRLGRVKRSGS